MKNKIIKILGGYTEKEFTCGKQEAFKNGNKSGLLLLRKVICSKKSSIKEDRLHYMSGFVDYICETVGINKVYNNGSYEKFVKEM